MDLMVLSDATVGISIGLFERLGAFVVDFDMGSDFAGEIGVESEDAAVVKSAECLRSDRPIRHRDCGSSFIVSLPALVMRRQDRSNASES